MVAIAVNHEDIADDQIPLVCAKIEKDVSLPAFDVLRDGPEDLVDVLRSHL